MQIINKIYDMLIANKFPKYQSTTILKFYYFNINLHFSINLTIGRILNKDCYGLKCWLHLERNYYFINYFIGLDLYLSQMTTQNINVEFIRKFSEISFFFFGFQFRNIYYLMKISLNCSHLVAMSDSWSVFVFFSTVLF